MQELTEHRKKAISRVVERIDNTVCVAILIAGSMPAIVVMLLIAFPLLPLFGVWVAWVATTGGPRETAEPIEHLDTAEPGPHHAPTPHYA